MSAFENSPSDLPVNVLTLQTHVEPHLEHGVKAKYYLLSVFACIFVFYRTVPVNAKTSDVIFPEESLGN